MTHEEFKDICLKEFPLIEGMVKTVKALGAHRISCDVKPDGHINFSIDMEKDNLCFSAYHTENMDAGEAWIHTLDTSKAGDWKTIKEETIYYETIPEADPDTTEDDLPFA
jgi:hypothetical protein